MSTSEKRDRVTDLNMPNGPSKPCVPLPVYQLVPCFACFRQGARAKNCPVCEDRRYIRVDPEKFSVYEIQQTGGGEPPSGDSSARSRTAVRSAVPPSVNSTDEGAPS